MVRFNSRDYVFRREEVGGLLFDRRTGVFYNLNPVAAVVLDAVIAGTRHDTLFQEIAERFDAPPAPVVRLDVRRLTSVFLEGGLLNAEPSGIDEWLLLGCHGFQAEELAFVQAHLEDTSVALLEVGCGVDFPSRWFGEYRQPMGIDVVVDLVACWNGDDRRAIADAARLPFASEEFDAVLLLGHVLGYLDSEDRAVVIAEAKRVLRSGGHVYVGAWTTDAIETDSAEMRWVEGPDGGRDLLHFFAWEELDSLLAPLKRLEEKRTSRNGGRGSEYVIRCLRKTA